MVANFFPGGSVLHIQSSCKCFTITIATTATACMTSKMARHLPIKIIRILSIVNHYHSLWIECRYGEPREKFSSNSNHHIEPIIVLATLVILKDFFSCVSELEGSIVLNQCPYFATWKWKTTDRVSHRK